MFKYAQLVKLARMSLARKLFVLKNIENSAMARVNKLKTIAGIAAEKNNPLKVRNAMASIRKTAPLVEKVKQKKALYENRAWRALLNRQASSLASLAL